MKLKTILAGALAALALAATAAGADPAPSPTSLADLIVPLQAGTVAPSNISCGIPPIPPIGCRVGDCVCDQSGNNCRWTFVCN